MLFIFAVYKIQTKSLWDFVKSSPLSKSDLAAERRVVGSTLEMKQQLTVLHMVCSFSFPLGMMICIFLFNFKVKL